MLPKDIINLARKVLKKQGYVAKKKCPFCYGGGLCEATNTICICVEKENSKQPPSIKTAKVLSEAVREYRMCNSK